MVKLCSIADYLEIVLPIVLRKPHLDFQITCLVIEMSGLFNSETVTKLLLEFELYAVILNVIELQINIPIR
jgi:hypothetical protein